MSETVSELFDASVWVEAAGWISETSELREITYHLSTDGRIARIAFNGPEVRNAFRPHTVDELYRALDAARMDSRGVVILLTGNGPSPRDGCWAFCSGGDQRVRVRDGYRYHNTVSDAGQAPGGSD